MVKGFGCTKPPADDMFPLEFGGFPGDTEILAWDYQALNQVVRLAIGGKSSSLGVVNKTGSGVIIMYDALDYSVIWKREFYRNDYAG